MDRMPARYYKPELDALRLFAFVSVFFFHLPVNNRWLRAFCNPGQFGMGIFFVLSAYLIVSLLLREMLKTGTVGLKAFALRRILRIWPLYFFALACFYVTGKIWPSANMPGHAVLAFSLLAGNLYIIRHGWIYPTAGALWSISVEEQFYVGIPAVVRFGGKRGIISVCVATVALSYAVLVWLGTQGASPILRVWCNSFVQFQFFAAGGLLAIFLADQRVTLGVPARLLLSSLGLALWALASNRFKLDSSAPSTPSQLVIGYLLALLGTVAVFLSALDIKHTPPKPAIYLGKISFGLYVFHQFWLWAIFAYESAHSPSRYFVYHRWQGTAIALAATIATAATSYRFLEQRVLKFKSRFEVIHSRPV
jgi:peptidoglycan/LPS O-acetylase OafA/YrhL